MPAIELLIFDCDGVLVDSERVCNQVLADLLAAHGVCLSLDQTIEKFIGKSLPQTLELAASLLGAGMPLDFRERLAERTRARLSAELTVVPGVEQMLAALPLPCCVASNGNRAKMTFTLTLTGLLGRFEQRMFSADEVAHPKPAPDLFLHAARTLGVQPGNCLVVEDTATGIAAAKAAGMSVYAYAGLTPMSTIEAAEPHGIIHSMLDVLALPGVSRRGADG